MRMSRGRWLVLVVAVTALVACGDDGNGDPDAGAPADAAVDGAVDAGALDAMLDAPVDAPVDATVDAPVDAASDAGPCLPMMAPRVAIDGAGVGIAVADLDSDDRRDLVVILEGARATEQTPAQPSAVEVRLGNGDGTFQPAARTVLDPTGRARPLSPVIGDVDGDGDLDVVIALSGVADTSIQLMLGDGQGHLAAGARLAPAYATSVALADLDRDGVRDIVAASAYDPPIGLSILFGTGGGGFATPVTLAAGTIYDSVAVGDVDADQVPDLVAVGVQVAVFRGAGNRMYLPPVETAIRADYGRQVVVGDLDGDGRADVATAGENAEDRYVLVETWTSAGGGALVKRTEEWLPWAEDWEFPPPDYFEGRFPAALTLPDLDGDAVLDVAVTMFSTDVLWVGRGDGTGAARDFTRYALSREPAALAAGDLDGDGRVDLVAAGEGRQIDVVLTGPEGVLRAPRGQGWPLRDPALEQRFLFALGYLDDDDRLDLVSGAVRVDNDPLIAGLGISNTSGPDTYVHLPLDFGAQEPDHTTVAFADIDGDADRDLLVTTDQAVSYTLSVFRNTGNGALAPRVDLTVDGFTMTVGDLDGDQRAEVIITSLDSTAVLANDGTGVFTPGAPFPSQWRAVLQDLDADGHLDLATYGTVAAVSVHLGNGDGTFQPASHVATPAVIRRLVVVDIDGDGDPDLAGDTPTATVVLVGNGDGTFAAGADLPGAPGALVAVADLDHAAPLDIVGTGGALLRAGAVTRAETWTIAPAHVVDVTGDGNVDIAGLGPRDQAHFVLASQCP
jgi:hypothetical protein